MVKLSIRIHSKNPRYINNFQNFYKAVQQVQLNGSVQKSVTG